MSPELKRERAIYFGGGDWGQARKTPFKKVSFMTTVGAGGDHCDSRWMAIGRQYDSRLARVMQVSLYVLNMAIERRLGAMQGNRL